MKSYLLSALLVLAMGVLAFFAGSGWGVGAQWAAVIYSVMVSVFLIAMIFGFVLSQVSYSEAVESAKHHVLEVEGIVCNSNDEA